MVETLLKRYNINYESVTDIDYMKSIGVKSTPTLSVDGTLMVGKPIVEWIKKQ